MTDMTDIADTTPQVSNDTSEETSILDRDTTGLDRQASQAALSAVREEAAKHRIDAREAKARVAELENRYQAFEQYDDEDRSTWLSLANGFASDPTTAAQDFRTIANNILGDPTSTPEEKAEAVEVLEQTQALTTETVEQTIEAKLAARDEMSRQQKAIADVHTKIEAAGYPQGTVDNFSVLWIANNDETAGGDLDKAIEIYKAKQQGVVTNYQNEIKSGLTKTPVIPNGQAGTPSQEITSMEDAGNAAKAFLAGRQRG